MNRIRRRLGFCVIGSLSLITCAGAQQSAAGRTAAVAQAASEAAARAVLARAMKTHGALHSYAATVEWELVSGSRSQHAQKTISFQAPNRYAVKLTYEGKTKLFVSDGTSVYADMAGATDDKRFSQAAMPSLRFGREGLLQWREVLGREVALMLAGANPLEPPWGRRPQKLKMGRPQTIAGDATDVVEVTYDGSDGLGAIVETYAISRRSHLLRGTSISGKDVKVRQTFKNIQVNPKLPASLFTFTFPPGAKIQHDISSEYTRLKVGDEPFPIEAVDIDGQPVILTDYKGKVVLLDFWATWCGPCLIESPLVAHIYGKYRSRGFEVIGISADMDQLTLTKHLKRTPQPWRHIFDGQGDRSVIGKKYAPPAIPFTVLIDRHGKVAAINPRRLDLEQAVADALRH